MSNPHLVASISEILSSHVSFFPEVKLLSLRSDEEIGPLSPLAVSVAAGFSGSVAAAASHCFDTAKTRTQCIVLPKVCYLLLKQFLYFLDYTTDILIIFTYHLILIKWCLFHLLPCDFHFLYCIPRNTGIHMQYDAQCVLFVLRN